MVSALAAVILFFLILIPGINLIVGLIAGGVLGGPGGAFVGLVIGGVICAIEAALFRD